MEGPGPRMREPLGKEDFVTSGPAVRNPLPSVWSFPRSCVQSPGADGSSVTQHCPLSVPLGGDRPSEKEGEECACFPPAGPEDHQLGPLPPGQGCSLLGFSTKPWHPGDQLSAPGWRSICRNPHPTLARRLRSQDSDREGHGGGLAGPGEAHASHGDLTQLPKAAQRSRPTSFVSPALLRVTQSDGPLSLPGLPLSSPEDLTWVCFLGVLRAEKMPWDTCDGHKAQQEESVPLKATGTLGPFRGAALSSCWAHPAVEIRPGLDHSCDGRAGGWAPEGQSRWLDCPLPGSGCWFQTGSLLLESPRQDLALPTSLGLLPCQRPVTNGRAFGCSHRAVRVKGIFTGIPVCSRQTSLRP